MVRPGVRKSLKNVTTFYKSLELLETTLNDIPSLEFCRKRLGGTPRSEMYRIEDAKEAVKDFLQFFKKPSTTIGSVKINWQSKYLSILLNGIEADKPSLNLKIEKFISTKPYFKDSDEMSYLVSVLEHFQVRFILIRSGNMSSENMEELVYTEQFQAAQGVALSIPEGVPIPNIGAPKMRISCYEISAREVYNMAKNFTVRNLPRGSFFGIFIDSTFSMEELRQLLAHRQVNDENKEPIVTCEWPAWNRNSVLHLKFSEKIVKGVICDVDCVEYDFQKAQQVDN